MRIAAVGQSALDNPGQNITALSGFPASWNGRASFIVQSGTTPNVRNHVYYYNGSANVNILTTGFTSIPLGGGPLFTNLGVSTGFGDGIIAFQGGNGAITSLATTVRGVYFYDTNTATFGRVASNQTVQPNSTGPVNYGTFVSGAVVSVSNGNFAFRSNGVTGQPDGSYVSLAGDDYRLTDTNFAIPGGTGNFTGGGDSPVISGLNVVTRASGASQQGVYFKNFSNVNNPVIRVADLNSPFGGTGTNNYTTIFSPSISGNAITFIAESTTANNQGVFKYVWDGSISQPTFTVQTLADRNTTVPGTTSVFATFTSFTAMQGNKTLFTGTYLDSVNATRRGVWLHDGTNLFRVIDNTVPLDGQNITNFLFSSNALSNDSFAFTALYTGGSAVYIMNIAPIPEPGTILAGASGLALLLYRRRKNSHTRAE